MVRRIAKYGWKSGILPKLKQVVPSVKAPFETVDHSGLRNEFKDPSMAPRGVAVNVPEKVGRTVESLIESSAPLPSSKSKKDETSMTEQQKWERLRANIRRTYHREALTVEGRREQLKAKHRQTRHETAEKLKETLRVVEETSATLLTMPTIESSLLKGTMIIPRTEEETRALKLKREANRKAAELRNHEKKMSQVLELYQNSKNYYLTVAELDKAVDLAFATNPGSSQNHTKEGQIITNSLGRDMILTKTIKDRQAVLRQILLGTTSSSDPGLGEIRDRLAKNAQKPPAESSQQTQ